MGYKLAGFEHLGGVEIDPEVADVYKTNHNPKYLFVQDIRDFANRLDFPEDLYNLDILDGSPPCSSFSMAGNREKDWGKTKVFREGQAEQRLDDLFFDYIRLAKKLQPKVVIAENVKGLIQGNAKAYVHRIKKEFEAAGYKVQLFLLNAASMGVPQKRERVFFICQRNDLNFPKLKLEFSEDAILFGDICEIENGEKIIGKMFELWKKILPSDNDLGQACLRETGKQNYFGSKLLSKTQVAKTIIASNSSPLLHMDKPYFINKNEVCKIGSFPLDYNFKKIEPKYLIGMSVPPVMTAQVATEIYNQWFNKTA
ncbi:MAG: DNA (cytosine-5-)-methyltransferase [Caulobacteraceae bacterium]|nr:DNA (cytosine-5-)-methyltransferase [Caulobacteraceae bacterium]